MTQTTIYDFLPPDLSFIEQIYTFNKSAGLLDKPYSDFLESSFQIEEALEGFSGLSVLQNLLIEEPIDGYSKAKAKDLSRAIVTLVNQDDVLLDVDRLDKACDAVVFAFGSMFKLGLTPEQAARAMSIVMAANMQKLIMPRDSFGKLLKPDTFEGPEAKLQYLLEES